MRLLRDAKLQSDKVPTHAHEIDWDMLLRNYDDTLRIVFLDGLWVSSVSRLPKASGIELESMTSALRSEDGRTLLGEEFQRPEDVFAAINSARFVDGYRLSLANNIQLDEPLEVINLFASNDGLAIHQRNAIRVGRDAKVTLHESSITIGDATAGLETSVTDIELSAGAKLTQTRRQQLSPLQHRVRRQHVRAAESAEYCQVSVDLGGAVVRNDDIVTLAGAGSRAELHGLYLVDARRHVDNRVLADHAAPGGTSVENYRGVLSGQGARRLQRQSLSARRVRRDGRAPGERQPAAFLHGRGRYQART